MSQAKFEKAAIDAKVSKVREVVRHVSNNDIILALHNFDMDVGRTISAFTEGVESALGSWENTGAKKKKANNKKKANGGSSNNSTTTDTPKVSQVTQQPKPTTSKPTPVAAPVKVDTTAAVQQFTKLDQQAKTQEVDRLAKELANRSRDLKNLLNGAETQKNEAIAALQDVLNHREAQLNAELAAVRAQVERQTQQQSKLLDQIQQRLASNSSAATEISNFTAANAQLDQILADKFTFDAKPPTRSLEKFGVVPHAGAVVVTAPTKTAPKQAAQPQQNGKQNGVEKKAEKKTNSPVKKVINGSDISTSQTSLISSVGEDSGLGQISPASQPQEKVRSEASGGGLVLGAEGISADALADIQKTLAASLKAQGIDETILSNLSGVNGTSVAPRRRQPKKDAPKSNGNQRNGKQPISSH